MTDVKVKSNGKKVLQHFKGLMYLMYLNLLPGKLKLINKIQSDYLEKYLNMFNKKKKTHPHTLIHKSLTLTQFY